MTRAQDLARLAALAGLIAERDRARLSAALAARDRTLALLSGLDSPPPAGEGEPAAALRNAAAYTLWVEQRRMTLTARLSAEERDVVTARAAAAATFGRARVLSRIAAEARRSPRGGEP